MKLCAVLNTGLYIYHVKFSGIYWEQMAGHPLKSTNKRLEIPSIIMIYQRLSHGFDNDI